MTETVPDLGGGGQPERKERRRPLLGKLLLAVLLAVILIVLLAIRSCSFLSLNTIVPPAGGSKVSAEECRKCHPDTVRSGIPHASDKVPCLRCHRTHPLSGADGAPRERGTYLIASQRELCVICHGSVGKAYDDAHQHPPFKLGECTVCHDPHGTDYPKMLKQPPNTLCTTCHFVADMDSAKQKHPPWAARDCIGCHSPHASDYPGMTKEKQPDVCLECHKNVAGELSQAVTHNPAGEACTKCHLPHVSEYAPMLKAPPPRLCYTCHASVEALFSAASHHPVPGQVNCTSCHFPHGSPFAKLLHAKGNDVCRACHADKVEKTALTPHGKTSRQGREPGSCQNCHVPHGSQWGPLLAKRQVPLCGECHERKTHPQENHPFDAPAVDPWHEQTMRCSSCHDPHGTQFPRMVRKEKDGLCLTCHPGVGVTF